VDIATVHSIHAVLLEQNGKSGITLSSILENHSFVAGNQIIVKA